MTQTKVLQKKRNFSKDKDSLTIVVYKKEKCFIIRRSPSWSKPHMVPTMLKNTFSLQWTRVCHPSAILRCSSEKQPMGVTCFARRNSHTRPRPSIFDTTILDTNSYTSEFALEVCTWFPTKSAHHRNFHSRGYTEYNCGKWIKEKVKQVNRRNSQLMFWIWLQKLAITGHSA